VSRADKSSNDRAPLCPICDTRHWTREPHVFKKKKAVAKPAGKKRW
jgi:hypothetical protein